MRFKLFEVVVIEKRFVVGEKNDGIKNLNEGN